MANIGTHIFLDICDFFVCDVDKLEETANNIFSLMKEIINNETDMTILHSHLEILREPKTPNGFTCVLLLDASHFTAHAYTNKSPGLIAFDLFTCGDTDTEKTMNIFIKRLKLMHPDIIVYEYRINDRF